MVGRTDGGSKLIRNITKCLLVSVFRVCDCFNLLNDWQNKISLNWTLQQNIFLGDYPLMLFLKSNSRLIFRMSEKHCILSVGSTDTEGYRSVPRKHWQNGRHNRHLVDCPYPCHKIMFKFCWDNDNNDVMVLFFCYSMVLSLTFANRRWRFTHVASVFTHSAQSLEKL